MSIISGQLVASPNAGASGIGPNSRLAVQLLDVSRMDASSVTLSEQVFQTGPADLLSFPIAYSLTYNPNEIKPYQSLSIAARVTDADNLTWITTSRHSVLTFHNPSDNVLVELDQVAEYSGEPAVTATINGNIFASSDASAQIAPNSKVTIQLLDMSLMDAPSVTLSEQVIQTGDDEYFSFPIQYRIDYDPNRIENHRSYSLSVRVENEAGDLTWTSTYSYSVLTRDAPSDHVSIEVEKIQY
ncbi:hypothetical protein BG003_011717 [Podila horticola]|nr:hypothetical protein BG003_011717 [Podila horticola]